MAVFSSLFGKLAQRLAPGSVGETLRSHVGPVPNPLSERSKHLQPRIHDAKMVKSVCPYCAVGCGQRVYVKDGKVIDIEGDYDSPVSGGCLCPKGSASYQLDINNRRWTTIIHVDPHFSRTSQHADIYAPIRVGSDIAFLGGLINYVLQDDLYFKEYVQAYTNATFIVGDDFQDAEDLEGVFSGLKSDHSAYNT